MGPTRVRWLRSLKKRTLPDVVDATRIPGQRSKEIPMKKLLPTIAVLLAFASGTALADANCDARAAEKKLSGAAKTSFLKKCNADAGGGAASACAAKALDKNGKALAGAARASFIKKCEKDAAAK
jgi:hypothetical protein